MFLSTTFLQTLTTNFTFILAFCAITALASWLIFFKQNTNRSNNYPPGPPGIPIFGNLLSLDPDLHTYFTGLARTYGPIFKLQLGSKLGIVITSPSLAREVLKENDTVFANRDVPAAGRAATYGGSDIVWTPYGPEWRMLRKICVLKMLSNNTLDSVYELRRNEVRKTVRFLYNRVGSCVNIGEQVFLTVLNVITEMMWGGAVEGDEREREGLGAEFRELVAEMTQLLGKPNVSDFFPGLARFDLQGVERDMKALVPKFDGIFEKMIGERKVKKNEEEGGDVKNKSNDFLQFLLELMQEGDSKTPLTMTHLKSLLMDMVIGGSDTSSNTIEFAMAEMMNNPEVMKRAQEELESVIGRNNMVEESHIQNLPYLQAVMKETLRLHPALPLLVPHCPSQNSTIGGFTIPKGSRIFINVWAIHRDPSIWENPLQFDPNRFLFDDDDEDGGANKWDFSGNDFNYFPFGSGRRICAGIAMAERTVLYSLATLVHSFDWKVPEENGQKFDVSEKFGIVLKMKVPLVAIPTPRLSNHELYK